MNKAGICILICFLIILQPSIAGEDTLSTATLPLEEILRLYSENERLKSPEQEGPPVKAVISRVELNGQLLEYTVDIKARFHVVVVVDNEWTEVPLFRLEDNVSISELPDPGDAVLVNRNNGLYFLTEKQGVYDFSVSFIKKAMVEGNKRTAAIRLEEASQSLFRIRFDETIFTIRNRDKLIRTSEGFVIYPDKGVFHLQWEQKKDTADKNRQLPDVQPEIESMVERAHASAVSTLEGNIILRVLYELRFTGKKSISFTVPDVYRMEKVYVNGIPRPFTIKDAAITLQVVPGRSGDLAGNVELVMSFHQGNYLLSGTVKYVLPGVSWPVHEMLFTLHMPEVFDYSFRGGSLKRIEIKEVPGVGYTCQIPEPGKTLSFHQYLIQSSLPSITLDYAIDLDGKYFCAPRL
jgi:hypothetical protein